ncbi:FUSC family protein [Thalassobacillus hwangdonensis]|uniref:Aromatic acid exporter family protein n=1 Tax=Thalassobacillus hwangdonensis TaxID=546108 RepID=A0ABW3KVX5_9BACI
MLQKLQRFQLFGSRTLKTGIAVFLTALICGFFNLPVIFAVITAIVTIEHTAADSLKKAMVRFPASAIGALLATSFYGVFGKGAITFALAAMLTIAICHKLKLDDGILVATITAVAMIPDFQDHYFVSFFSRLGTTSIGIVISTLVNFFLLPPNYLPDIQKNIQTLFNRAAVLMEMVSDSFCKEDKRSKRMTQRQYNQITVLLERTYQLSQFQREEWKYHKHSNEEMRVYQFAQKQLSALQQIAYHLGNMQYTTFGGDDFSEREKLILERMIRSFVEILKEPAHGIPESHFQLVKELDQMFWRWKEEHVEQQSRFRHHLPPQTVLIYELLCLHDVIEELQELASSRHAVILNPSADK